MVVLFSGTGIWRPRNPTALQGVHPNTALGTLQRFRGVALLAGPAPSCEETNMNRSPKLGTEEQLAQDGRSARPPPPPPPAQGVLFSLARPCATPR